jgi:hypothetical protein
MCSRHDGSLFAADAFFICYVAVAVAFALAPRFGLMQEQVFFWCRDAESSLAWTFP